MPSSFKANVAARLTYLVLFAGVGTAGGIVAGWLLPLLASVAHGGLAGLSALQVEYKVFPAAPRFVGQGPSGILFMVATGLVAIAGFALSAKWGLRYWRRLVVAKGWLTDEEAKYFVERDDGF